MALIKCQECGGQVSTKAAACPHCGAKGKHFKRQALSMARVVKLGALITGVLVIVGLLGPDGSDEQPNDQTARPEMSYKINSKSDFQAEGDQALSTAWACQTAMAHAFNLPLNKVSVIADGEPSMVRIERADGSQENLSCKLAGNQILWKPTQGRSWTEPSREIEIRYARNRLEVLSMLELPAQGTTSYRVFGIRGLPLAYSSEPKISNNPEPATALNVSHSQICKAAIAAIFSQPPGIIRVETQNSPYHLTYERPADKSRWTYRCKVAGNQVVWAGLIDGKWGRWRNGEHDAEITYEVTGSTLHISETYPGARPVSKQFDIATL
ncbi:zinc ribbon domain-containing protein [Marinobacter nauticus]|nr:zinc ribbon domain-containing protein [Marinobacter nauticus]